MEIGRSGDDAIVTWVDTPAFFLNGEKFPTCIRKRLESPPAPLIVKTRFGLLQQTELFSDIRVNRPHGLIFHVSRCGSTLLSRILGAPEDCCAISEAGPINALLLMAEFLPRETLKICLHNIITAYMRNLGSNERMVFKLSSWSNIYLKRIREVFDGAPQIFLYRDPIEVISSNMKHPASFMRYTDGPIGERLSGKSEEELEDLNPIAFLATTIQQFQNLALQHLDDRTLILNYSDLIKGQIDPIFNHIGIQLDDAARACAAQQFEYHAREGKKPYPSGGFRLGTKLDDSQKDQIPTTIWDSYQQLEDDTRNMRYLVEPQA